MHDKKDRLFPSGGEAPQPEEASTAASMIQLGRLLQAKRRKAADAGKQDTSDKDNQSAPAPRRVDATTTPEVQAAASQGTGGASSQLPHLDAIQRSFGTHDVSQVKAHTDAAAARGASAIGAEAFATGDHVAFSGTPSLHTAAHEAAHVVQQRGGVQLMGGLGQQGDAYEQHADAVADRVVQGQSAENLLGAFAGSSRDARAPIQRKEARKGAPPSQKKAAPPTFAQLRTEIATYIQTRIRDTEDLLRAVRAHQEIKLPDFGPHPDPSPGVHEDPAYARNQKVPEGKPAWAKPPSPPAGPEIPQGSGPREAGPNRPGTHIATLTVPFDATDALEAARPIIKASISGLEKAAGALAGALAKLSEVDLSIHLESSPSLNNAVNSGIKAAGQEVAGAVKTVEKVTSAVAEAGRLFAKGLEAAVSVAEFLGQRPKPPASEEKPKKSEPPAKPPSQPSPKADAPRIPKAENQASQELPKLGEQLKSIMQREHSERMKILSMLEIDLGDLEDDILADLKTETITSEEAAKLRAELEGLRKKCSEVREHSTADQPPEKAEGNAPFAPQDD